MPEGLRIRGLRIAFGPDPVVDVDDLALAAGSVVAVTGPSGSGKTTLFNLLCGILRPPAGTVVWDGFDVGAAAPAACDAWRRTRVGLVFQDFHLVPGLGVLDNVLAPVWFGRLRAPDTTVARARDLLSMLGVPAGRAGVDTLSRGERQRVALARALLHRPPILLADEPTASLDVASGATVADLLLAAAADSGATLIVVTHDPALLARLPRRLDLVRGRLAEAA